MSSIDMSQFHAVFFEESFEGLQIMETGLLELSPGEPDLEAINTIFRAAHSIKGGSGTFGFKNIASFTHVMETLLDEMRDGVRNVTQEVNNLLLKSVDCLREMLEAARDDTSLDEDSIAQVQAQLEAELGNGTKEPVDSESTSDAPKDTNGSWKIKFFPHDHLYQTGNDPVRIFRELSNLGKLSSSADTENLPSFSDIDPEHSYLRWDLSLETESDLEAIKEVFSWVEDDCELDIQQQLSSVKEEKSETKSETEAETEAVKAAPAVVETTERREVADRRKKDRRGKSEGTSIRVNIDKIDTLINMVGELVITQSMLSQYGENIDISNLEQLRIGLGQLERNTRELQENVMQIRMLPISFSFNRFPRLVHDLNSKLNKKIELKISGESTELDKTVMEKIGDPLVHLVRNSLDHGIEMPEDRLAAGKPETGILHLNAFHEGGNIVIEISDDGAGLNKEKILAKARERGLLREDEALSDDQIHTLIFRPGFSTAEQVSDVSGRGVGMDVVRRNIHDLGGVVEVQSTKGSGSTFRIRLPLTLAIVDGQLVRVGNQTYIVPLISIVESLQISSNEISSVAGKMELYRLRDDYIPIIRLHNVFATEPDSKSLENGLLVIVESEGQKAGLFVDDLLAQQQVVIKSLETNYQKVGGIAGATILGDGTVAMILDISALLEISQQENSTPPTTSLFDGTSGKAA